jgi:hypothetical protein
MGKKHRKTSIAKAKRSSFALDGSGCVYSVCHRRPLTNLCHVASQVQNRSRASLLLLLLLYELFMVVSNRKKPSARWPLIRHRTRLDIAIFLFYFISCLFFSIFSIPLTLPYDILNHILTYYHVHCGYYRTVPPRHVMRFSNFITLARIISSFLGGAVVRVVC